MNLQGEQPNLKLVVKIVVGSKNEFSPAFVAFDIRNSMNVTIIQAIPINLPFIEFNGEDKEYEIEINLIGLIPDLYSVSVWIGPHNNETYDWAKDVAFFEIYESPLKNRTFPHYYDNGYLIANSKIKSVLK